MKRIELVRAVTDSKKLASLMIDLVEQAPTVENLSLMLEKELTEEQLQTIKSIAVNTYYPLSLDIKQ